MPEDTNRRVERDDEGAIAEIVDVLDHSPISPPPPGTTRTEIELPWRTVLRVLLTLGLLWFIYATADVLLQIFIGFLLAAALFPLVWRLERRGMRRGVAVVAVLLSTVAVFVIVAALVVPSLVEEAADFWNDLPTSARESLSFLRNREPELYARIISYVDEQTADPAVTDIDVEQAISGGMTIFGILAGIVAAVAVAAFTLTTGDETLRSLGRGLPRGQEEKVRRLVPEVIRVVSGYIVGQTINSTLFAIFTFSLFTILDLPSPLVAAVIAFVLDAVPIIGATLATGIFAVLALAQGTTEFVIIIIACLIYQQFENYVTSPRVFGRTLRISPFVSLIAVLIGSTLMGIPGVLLGPPVAALISAAFKVWGDDLETVTGPGNLRLAELADEGDEATQPSPAAG